MFSGPPPAYHNAPQAYGGYGATPTPRWYDVRHWKKRTMIIAAAAFIIILIIIIVVSVVEVRNNRYPDYSKLNYVLKDNCQYWTLLYVNAF